MDRCAGYSRTRFGLNATATATATGGGQQLAAATAFCGSVGDVRGLGGGTGTRTGTGTATATSTGIIIPPSTGGVGRSVRFCWGDKGLGFYMAGLGLGVVSFFWGG